VSVDVSSVDFQIYKVNFRLPILTDINILRRELNPTLFPGISSNVQVHDGFADVQEK
jgi:hypothetical protein